MFGLMPELTDEQYERFLAWQESEASEGESVVVIEPPSVEEVRASAEAQALVIEAQADAAEQLIEAQAEADVRVMEAQAAIENPADDDDATMFDSEGNARPESQHWFWRRMGGK